MNAILVTLTLVIAVILLLYVYLVWHFGYWKRRGVKEMKSYPFVGSMPSQFNMKRNVSYDLDEFYSQYKKDENFVGVFNCRIPQLLILNPDYLHKVFVNDFKHFHDNEISAVVDAKKDKLFANNPFVLTGSDWKERRAEVTPGLTNSRIGAVYPVTVKVCKALSKYIALETSMGNKDGIDAKKLSLRYTTEVVSDCVLGISANSLSDKPSPIYDNIQKAFNQTFTFVMFAALVNVAPQIRKIYTPTLFPQKISQFFIDLMQQSINLRKQTVNAENRVDFLNYILHLQKQKNLSIEEVTSHTMTFLTDGFETSALVLAHALLLLGRNPQAQQKLRAEVGDKELPFEELLELKYAEACITETLRIFPALLSARKLCTEEYEFVNKNGTTVKVFPGQVVIMPIYSINHDPEYYEEPEEFRPERFLEENGGVKKYREKGLYNGFGDGPRVCIGQRFATVQIKAALAQIVRDYNIKINPKTRKDNYLDETYFLATLQGGIYLDFEKRN